MVKWKYKVGMCKLETFKAQVKQFACFIVFLSLIRGMFSRQS